MRTAHAYSTPIDIAASSHGSSPQNPPVRVPRFPLRRSTAWGGALLKAQAPDTYLDVQMMEFVDDPAVRRCHEPGRQAQLPPSAHTPHSAPLTASALSPQLSPRRSQRHQRTRAPNPPHPGGEAGAQERVVLQLDVTRSEANHDRSNVRVQLTLSAEHPPSSTPAAAAATLRSSCSDTHPPSAAAAATAAATASVFRSSCCDAAAAAVAASTFSSDTSAAAATSTSMLHDALRGVNRSSGANTKLAPEDFTFLCVVGQGTYGKVFQVLRKGTDQVYAMKVRVCRRRMATAPKRTR
jgi:hypothetical protein